jgi:hypothetical protein
MRPVPVFLLEAWYSAGALLVEPAEPAPVRVTWKELQPERAALVDELSARDLEQLDDWLTLAQVLATYDPDALTRLEFYEPSQQRLLAHVAVELGEVTDPDLAALAETVLRRIRELSPQHRDLARTTLTRLKAKPSEERWWVPHDIDKPPTTEPVARGPTGFTRADVDRVLADL